MKYRVVLLAFIGLFLGSTPPTTAAEWPKTVAECPAFRKKLRNDAPGAARYTLWTEGLARFYGVCFQTDRWAGIDRVERAVMNGAEGASLDLVTLYSEIGDTQAGEKWRDLAAIFVWNQLRQGRENPFPGSDPNGTIAHAAKNIAADLETDDVAAIVARLEKLAARPPILRGAEVFYWLALTQRLFTLGANEYAFWLGLHAWREAFRFSDAHTMARDLENAAFSLRRATYCDDIRAARLLSGLIRIEKHNEDAKFRAEIAIGRLHRQTGALSQEVAAIERQIGRPIFTSEEEFVAAKNLAANACLFPRVRGLHTQDESAPPRTDR